MRRALLVVPLLLAGCFSPPEVRYFTLRGAASERPSALAANGPALLVDRFVVDEPYTDARLAYRADAHELGYDPYSRWAGSPVAQVEDSVRDLLRASGLFSAVRQAEPAGVGRVGYDLVVAGRVARLEEIDHEESWEAALDLELLLIDARTHQVLRSVRHDARATADKRNPHAVVAKLSDLLAQAVAKFIDEVKPVVAARRR